MPNGVFEYETTDAIPKHTKYRTQEKINCTKEYLKAIRSGAVIKPKTCSKCPNSGKIFAIHVDYTRPLDPIYLCSRCFMAHSIHKP